MSRGRRSSQRGRVDERRGLLKGTMGKTENEKRGRLSGRMAEGGGAERWGGG